MGPTVLAVLVSAAISLKAPLEQAARQFQASAPGEEITFNFGASGQLAAQIVEGAPADLFVSASPADVDRLATAKRIDPASRTAVAGNKLVVIAPKDFKAIAEMADLVQDRFKRVALGNAKTVPAGRYAREALAVTGVYETIPKRLVFAENVRQVADLVARGEAEAGFVYATDVAAVADKVHMILEVPQQYYTPIAYEGAVVEGGAGAVRARAFLDYLASPDGRALFVKEGFLPPKAPAVK